MARAYFLIYILINKILTHVNQHKKIRQNADLINPISACPFAEPITECPFIPYYALNNEREQIMQIDEIPHDKLDELRKFHRACMERYRNGEWKSRRVKNKTV